MTGTGPSRRQLILGSGALCLLAGAAGAVRPRLSGSVPHADLPRRVERLGVSHGPTDAPVVALTFEVIKQNIDHVAGSPRSLSNPQGQETSPLNAVREE